MNAKFKAVSLVTVIARLVNANAELVSPEILAILVHRDITVFQNVVLALAISREQIQKPVLAIVVCATIEASATARYLIDEAKVENNFSKINRHSLNAPRSIQWVKNVTSVKKVHSVYTTKTWMVVRRVSALVEVLYAPKQVLRGAISDYVPTEFSAFITIQIILLII